MVDLESISKKVRYNPETGVIHHIGSGNVAGSLKSNKYRKVCVSYDTETGKWLAAIRVNGARKNLGRYKDIDQAILARSEANNEYGFHINHGRPSNA